jgi:hypothetical protein
VVEVVTPIAEYAVPLRLLPKTEFAAPAEVLEYTV